MVKKDVTQDGYVCDECYEKVYVKDKIPRGAFTSQEISCQIEQPDNFCSEELYQDRKSEYVVNRTVKIISIIIISILSIAMVVGLYKYFRSNVLSDASIGRRRFEKELYSAFPDTKQLEKEGSIAIYFSPLVQKAEITLVLKENVTYEEYKEMIYYFSEWFAKATKQNARISEVSIRFLDSNTNYTITFTEYIGIYSTEKKGGVVLVKDGIGRRFGSV